MDKLEKLYKYLPKDKIDWDLILNELLLPFKDDLRNTPQEAKWHGEGDVLTHTIMVCEELIKLDEYQELNETYKLVVFLAALFHDIAKPTCTSVVDGEIRSFKHPKKGALITRKYFWKDLGLSGVKEYQEVREAIALLVKYHPEPTYLDYEKDKMKLIIKLSTNTKLTKYFTNQLLYLLAKADILGRISDTNEEKLLNVAEFKEIAINLNCYTTYFKFNDDYTKYKYLTTENMWHNQSIFDPTWGEVILLCGLPGTGKDTFIKKYYSNYKVISLDNIRREHKIKPTENQGEVYVIAKEMAKEYLRNQIPFIFNATNFTKLTRQNQIDLFHQYSAKVKVIFLETSWEENIKRDKNRRYEVSEKIIDEMLIKLEIAENFEAETVEWICI